MTDILKTMRDIEQGVTPGPWESEEGSSLDAVRHGAICKVNQVAEDGYEIAMVVYGCDSRTDAMARADAKFIAFARNTWPQIVAVVEAASDMLRVIEAYEKRELDAGRAPWTHEYGQTMDSVRSALSGLAGRGRE
ncbi:MAG: hypothetical protein E6Q97_19255 [Desulfurellales bacterium]|nr:MAG: hypothetical protein E6Q97_19255 [Desulfurellales bacterium]